MTVTTIMNSNNNQATNNSNNPVTNNITNNTTDNIQIRLPDMDKHDNFQTTTKGGSMTQEWYLHFINQVIIKHTNGTPAAWFLDAASINRSV